MISFETVKLSFRNLSEAELTRWIDAALVHADGAPGAWNFQEIDVARIRLIMELRQDLEIEEQALPVVLSLVDQIYDMRRRMTQLNAALADVPADVRMGLLSRLE